MATERAIAVLRKGAVDRIVAASKELSTRFEGVEVPELEKVSGRNDPDLKFAQQLDLLAGVLEQVVSSSGLMQTSNANRLAELETKLQASEKALGDQQEMANSIIKDHQGYIQKLELELTDAQTQLLALKKNEPAVPADSVKDDGKAAKGGK